MKYLKRFKIFEGLFDKIVFNEFDKVQNMSEFEIEKTLSNILGDDQIRITRTTIIKNWEIDVIKHRNAFSAYVFDNGIREESYVYIVTYDYDSGYAFGFNFIINKEVCTPDFDSVDDLIIGLYDNIISEEFY